MSTLAILGLAYLAATADALNTIRASPDGDIANIRKVHQTEGIYLLRDTRSVVSGGCWPREPLATRRSALA